MRAVPLYGYASRCELEPLATTSSAALNPKAARPPEPTLAVPP